MLAKADITAKAHNISLNGNLAGQKLALILAGDTLTIDFSASCVNPCEIKAKLTIQEGMNIADILEGQGGVNVDPSKLQACVGEDLEAALNKIAGEYNSLGGYTGKQATAALNKIASDASIAYNKTKDAARDVANVSSSGAMQAFKDAGNAFKKRGKKKKHSKGPDPKFALSVFDWDFYYDVYSDLVQAKVDLPTHWRDNGFKEGRQGAPEFSAVYYRNRYFDVQQLCSANDDDCVLKHWLDKDIDSGRQGSADVSVASYPNRYGDLQSAFGRENYEDALDHWLKEARPSQTH